MLYIVSLIGCSVFAMSGVLAASSKKMDWIGAFTLAFITATGGGTLRDILLGRGYAFWMEDVVVVYIILVTAILGVAFIRFFTPPLKLLVVLDAIGLGVFAIQGAQVAEQFSHASIVVVIMGVMTGVFGGVTRDVIVNRIPLIFRSGEPLYSIACIIGVSVYLFAKQYTFIPYDACVYLGMFTVIAIRLLAVRYSWALPTISVC